MPRTRKAKNFAWIPLGDDEDVNNHIADKDNRFASVEEAEKNLSDSLDSGDAGNEFAIVELKKVVHACQPSVVHLKDGHHDVCHDCDC